MYVLSLLCTRRSSVCLLTDATPKCGRHTSILSAVKEKVYPKRKNQLLDVTPLLMESQVIFQASQQNSTEAISDKERYLVLKCIKKMQYHKLILKNIFYSLFKLKSSMWLFGQKCCHGYKCSDMCKGCT